MDQAVVFGRHDHLVGVVSSPATGSLSGDVAVIMLTPGMLHHVGPFRMHVELARSLASHGIRSLRFDLSGIGESLGVGTAGTSIDRSAGETREAMDYLAKYHGCRRFVLFGLCSGADDSMHTALVDRRVVGFVAIDGLGYRTKRFYWHRLLSHYLPRVFSPRKWSQVFGRIFASGAAIPKTLQMGTDLREFPEGDEATRQLQSLVDRHTQMHFIYTGGVPEYYNYENQFFEMLPDVDFRNAASTKYFPFMDHVALLCEDRDELVAHITEHVVSIIDAAIEFDEHGTNSNALTAIRYPVSGVDESFV